MKFKGIIKKVIDGRQKIKEMKPLVHHITNYVTATDLANITLCSGAYPVMVDNKDEIEDIIRVCDSLVLNIGTLSPEGSKLCFSAVELANRLNKSIILDPVGVGAINSRKELVQKLLEENSITIVKGNLAEIKSIINLPTRLKGVDSLDESGDFLKAAMMLARKHETIAVVTGERDVITNGREIVTIENGDSLLTSVTGAGCMTASLIGCFCGTGIEPFYAAIGGILTMTIAGELAAKGSNGPGMFHYRLMDEIYNVGPSEYNNLAKIKYEKI